MTRAGLGAAALATVLALQAAGQQDGHADPVRLLRGFIDLQIIDEQGHVAGPSARLLRPVDVNGGIRVRFRRDSLRAYQDVPARAESDTLGQRLTLQVLADLARFPQVAGRLARAATADSAAFAAASDSANAWRSRYIDHVDTYFAYRARREQPDRPTRDVVRELRIRLIGRDKMAAFSEYLQTDLARLLETAAAATAGPGTLRLAAFRRTGGGDSIQVKIPNYDSTVAGPSTVIRKITTDMTDDERAQFAFAQEASTRVRNVRDLAAFALSDYTALAGEARSAALELFSAVDAAAARLRTLPADQLLRRAVPAGATQGADRLVQDLQETRAWLASVDASVSRIRQSLEAAFGATRDPFTVLASVRDAVAAAVELRREVPRAPRLADRIQADLGQLGQSVQALDSLQLPTELVAPLARVAAAFNRLDRVAGRVETLLQSGAEVRGVAEAFSDDHLRRLRLVDQAVTTAPESEILLLQAGGDRTAGDQLVVHAELVGSAGRALGVYEWTFLVEKLGASSRFAAGVGFVGQVQGSRDALRPAPVLAWVLRSRSRGESATGRFWNFLDPSIGFHTITLSSANEPIQFGMGGSLNLLNDFLQLGIGRNLQPQDADDRWYWYVGLGLFKLAQRGS